MSDNEASQQKGRSVLLVDDNDMDNEFHEMVISETEKVDTILVARNGLEGLEVLRKTASTPSEPSLILLDINMPVMDGFEFLTAFKDLRDELNLKSTVVVMLTTSLMDMDEYHSHSIPGLIGYLVKPLTEEAFLGILENGCTPEP